MPSFEVAFRPQCDAVPGSDLITSVCRTDAFWRSRIAVSYAIKPRHSPPHPRVLQR